MMKHDVIVIGDSLATIHCALELARGDISLLLVRPDVFPVEVHETSHGAFDCDIASGCDMSYYITSGHRGKLYDIEDKIEKYPFPFRIKSSSFLLEEPSRDYDYQVNLVKNFPAHRSELMSFLCHTKFIHELADEIEVKTGIGTSFIDIPTSLLFTQLPPWTFNKAKSLIALSFNDFISQLNLPEEFKKLYEVMCHDRFGLGPDSIDALSGVEMITRRIHGLSYPRGGWVMLKDAMLERLRNRRGVRIIGGKRIDMLKSSGGIACEIYIDERGKHSADWFVIDETTGLLEMQKFGADCGRYIPVGCCNRSHVDFRLFLGWESPPKSELPTGVNYYYGDMRFPPHAPHLIRLDIMPPSDNDPYGLVSRITVRGKYPWERLITSSGYIANQDELKNEILNVSRETLGLPVMEPSFACFMLPRNYRDSYNRLIASPVKTISPCKFSASHENVRIISSTSLNGGSMRLAFRCAERIAGNIIRNIQTKKKLREFVSLPITRMESFKRIATARMEEMK